MHAKAMIINYEAQVKQEEIEALRRGVKERSTLIRLIAETLVPTCVSTWAAAGGEPATDSVVESSSSVESVASSAPPPTVPGPCSWLGCPIRVDI